MKPLVISSRNIRQVIAKVKSQLDQIIVAEPSGLILPRCERVLSTRYRGKGRPRKADYDYVEIDWAKVFPSSSFL